MTTAITQAANARIAALQAGAAGSQREQIAREVAAAVTVQTIAASGAAATIPSPSDGKVVRVTLTANCTFTFPAASAGQSFLLELVQDGTGSRTATWPAAVRWPGGTNPTLTTTAARRDVFEFTSTDGSTWSGRTVGLNYTA